MVRMGIVAEAAGETRVAATPTTVVKLIGLGYEVAVEAGAGRASSFPDAAYADAGARIVDRATAWGSAVRSEEHTSELQSLMRISYAVFCLKKKNSTHQYLYPLYHT